MRAISIDFDKPFEFSGRLMTNRMYYDMEYKGERYALLLGPDMQYKVFNTDVAGVPRVAIGSIPFDVDKCAVYDDLKRLVDGKYHGEDLDTTELFKLLEAP